MGQLKHVRELSFNQLLISVNTFPTSGAIGIDREGLKKVI